MQVTVVEQRSGCSVRPGSLNAAFRHHANGSGVFESGSGPDHRRAGRVQLGVRHELRRQRLVQRPWLDPASAAATRCDGFARIQEGNHPTDLFGFNGLRSAIAPGVGKVQIPFQPKGIHDEMNSTRPSTSSGG